MRAKEIVPVLRRFCETDVLISGYQSDLELPFDVRFRLRGLSFIFGRKGGVDIRKTYHKAKVRVLLQEIKDLPVEEYDLVLNDFEPVSAWSCVRKKIPCVALSHQASLLQKNIPKPSKKDAVGKFILENYAPAFIHFGFHFSRYSRNIFTPVIRSDIRSAEQCNLGHYTVYLPAYDDAALIDILGKIPQVEWHVFSKHNKVRMQVNHITIHPIDQDEFLKSFVSCNGILCGAGFETPAEALHMGKKLMVVPMRNQYEQQFNAVALKTLGVPVIKKLKISQVAAIAEWVESDYRIEITYPDNTEKILNHILSLFVNHELPMDSKQKFRLIKYR
jgi:uncharacterized protein (TIGR00661 family)